MKPNKHDWRPLFEGNTCKICYASAKTGTAKGEHARKHVRQGEVARIGSGTVADPYRYGSVLN